MSKGFLAVLMSMAVMVVSCNRDDEPDDVVDNPMAEKILIAEQTGNQNEIIRIFSDDELIMGYNEVYVQIEKDGAFVTNYEVELSPLMSMSSGMTHACPIEQPTVHSDGYYQGAVAFVMPTSDMGTWNLSLGLMPNGGGNSEIDFGEVQVLTPEYTRMFSFMNPLDSTPTFVALVDPMNPTVGMNDFEVAIFEKESMMSWPPVEGLSATIYPEMPTMGHSSPGNVNPEDILNGHYKGEVNFTMTGYWEVTLDLYQDTSVVQEGLVFSIEF